MADNQFRGIEGQDCPAIRVTQNAGCPSIRVRITGGGGGGYKFTGHADVEGLTALGWDAQDIAFLQANVWWNEEEDDYWKVTPENLAFGPNGATPLTWSNRAAQKTNPDIRFYPKLDTPPGTSWSSLFNGYNRVRAIPTHGWDTSAAISMANLLSGCTHLRSIDLSGWDVSNVTNMTGLCQNCSNLITVGDISGWDTSAVITMDYMFYNCSLIRSLDLSGWDVSNVTNMSAMFTSCSSLVSVGDISGWDVSNVTDMGSMFSYCSSLGPIGDISGWDVSKVANFNTWTNRVLLWSYLDLSGLDLGSATNVGTGAGSSILTGMLSLECSNARDGHGIASMRASTPIRPSETAQAPPRLWSSLLRCMTPSRCRTSMTSPRRTSP